MAWIERHWLSGQCQKLKQQLLEGLFLSSLATGLSPPNECKMPLFLNLLSPKSDQSQFSSNRLWQSISDPQKQFDLISNSLNSLRYVDKTVEITKILGLKGFKGNNSRKSFHGLVYNNETATTLVSQTSPVGVELFSYADAFFCSNKFA